MQIMFNRLIEYLRMNFKLCVLIGCRSYFDDSGYAICVCGNSEGCDYMYWHVGILNIPKIIIGKQVFFIEDYFGKYFHKCYDCKRFEKFFGKNVGKHEKCVPF